MNDILLRNPNHCRALVASSWMNYIIGTRGFFEARVDINYRMTYIRLADDTIEMSNVDKHDEALKKP